MKLFLLGAAVFLFGSFFSKTHRAEPTVLLIGGSTDGYLSPCGCTKPMSGGIRRRVKAILSLSKSGNAVVIENGGLVSGTGRQDEMKAETIAESLKAAGVDAINLTSSEAALGPSMVSSLRRLSGDAFITGSARPEDESLPATKRSGPFLIGAATAKSLELSIALSGKDVAPDRVAKALIEEAEKENATPILMLDGSFDLAKKLAGENPKLALVVYRSTGDPPGRPERVGNTLLVTPGEHGKHVIRLIFDKRLGDYSVVRLGPDVDDDETAGRAYGRYLDRVTREKLLERIPRLPGDKFAGTKTCGSCHSEAYAVWQKSEHSHALKTLEDEKHDRDPDCTACHVVGLEFDTGFQDRAKTPDLANVGCESCHGAGLDHAENPSVKMGKVGEASCMKCHTKEHSPTFDFEAYWKKVIHN